MLFWWRCDMLCISGLRMRRLCRILIQDEQREQVDTFPYLGSLITEDGGCTTEFRTRLNRGQAIGPPLQKIWKVTSYQFQRSYD